MEAARQAGLSDEETFTLANFSYSNSIIAEKMFHHLNDTDFLGITVRCLLNSFKLYFIHLLGKSSEI